jgi:HlyD family secretion protein
MLWVIFLAIIVVAFVIARSSTREVVEIHAAAVTRQNLVSAVSTNGKAEPIGEFQAYSPAA